MKLLYSARAPLFVLYPDTSTGINVSHLLIKSIGKIFTSDILDDNLVKSDACAPISKDIVREILTFLGMIENKLFDVDRARHNPVSNLFKSEYKILHQLRTSKDIVIRLQDKGSRFVILD